MVSRAAMVSSVILAAAVLGAQPPPDAARIGVRRGP